VLCFTAEEAWLSRFPGDGESVHLRTFPDTPDAWRDDVLAAKWETVRRVRRAVTGALEIARAEKKIGSSLQADPLVVVPEEYLGLLESVDFADICITSDITLQSHDVQKSMQGVPGRAIVDPRTGEASEPFVLDDVKEVSVLVRLADGEKCERCWRILPEVGSRSDAPRTCVRCADAVQASRAAAE